MPHPPRSLALISYLLQLSTLVLGVLIKLSFVALAAPTILVLVGTELTHRQSYGFEKLIKVLALPLIGIGLMAPAGMGISDGWHYITGPNKDVVSGYSEAMALYRRRNDWQQLPYWLASGFTISLLVTGLKRRLQWRSPWWSVLMVGVSAIYFWSPFKAGMVRHDGGHFPMSGLFLLTAGVLTLMLFWRELNPKRAWLWLVMLLPVVAGYSISSKNWLLTGATSCRNATMACAVFSAPARVKRAVKPCAIGANGIFNASVVSPKASTSQRAAPPTSCLGTPPIWWPTSSATPQAHSPTR